MTPIRVALQSPQILRVGHRGAANLAPENTIPALEAALQHGVDMVEFDVVRGSNGKLMLAHDAADIGPHSPTLEAALKFLEREAPPGLTLDLDLKVANAEREIVDALKQAGLLDRTLVCALHAPWLQAVKRVEPTAVVGLSYPRDRAGIASSGRVEPLVVAGTSFLRRALPYRVVGMARRAGASAVMLHHSVVSSATVRRCDAAGFPVFAWTVDDPETLASVISAGVRGVISNDPRVLSHLEPDRMSNA